MLYDCIESILSTFIYLQYVRVVLDIRLELVATQKRALVSASLELLEINVKAVLIDGCLIKLSVA